MSIREGWIDVRLTKEAIERAKGPEPSRKERFLRDDVVRGLGVRITTSGAKSFIFEARIKGRPRRLTLGGWPDLNIALARQRALELRTRIARGEDPATEARDARHETTFGELCDVYMERHAKPHKRSAGQDEDILRRLVPSGWKNRKLSDLSRAELARLHAKVGADQGHYAANRTIALLRAMFNLGRTWQLLKGDNPATGIKPFREHKRERFLSPEELQKVNTALLDEPDWRWRAYFPLALMLGTRKNELLAMRWSDVDLEQRTWRIPETKGGHSHLLPLPAPAIAILTDLPSRRQSAWVFPSDSARGHSVDPSKAWQRVRNRAGVSDVRIHDLRHTLASWLVARGFGLPLVGRALNHSQVATTARYAHLALDPIRAALEETAALMMPAVASGESSPVEPQVI
jgi:integrase